MNQLLANSKTVKAIHKLFTGKEGTAISFIKA
jgi:hypothetical protein